MAAPTVLVVDDNPEARSRLERWLVQAGYRPLTAAHGLEAIERLRSDLVDLILSDVLMPRMDGYQLCRAVKREGEWARIPFVFYSSAFVDRLHRELGQSLGAAEYLVVRPEKRDDLLAALAGVLERHRRGALAAAEASLQDELAFQRAYHQALWQKLSGRLAEDPELRDLLERYGNQVEALQQIRASLQADHAAEGQPLFDLVARALEHEINNPLAIIMAFAQLAERNTTDPDLQEAFHGIERMVVRINDVVRRLKELKEVRLVHTPLGEMLDLSTEEPPDPAPESAPRLTPRGRPARSRDA
jgi:CheY-like chemotaxis protein